MMCEAIGNKVNMAVIYQSTWIRPFSLDMICKERFYYSAELNSYLKLDF